MLSVSAERATPAATGRGPEGVDRHSGAIGVPPTTSPNSVAMRKLLLRRHSELLFIFESFAEIWNQYFPHHDVQTLQFEPPAKSKAKSYWDAPSWKASARAYHEEQKRLARQPASDPKTAQLRRLLSDSISLDAAYRELNAPENRPTPQSTIEAIMWCVRERGVGALKEPDNQERLARCDEAARERINDRIDQLMKKAGVAP
jgi:hypothetical protein